MANYYVASTGDNTNDGLSPATAFQDLGYAMTNVTDEKHNIYVIDDVEATKTLCANVTRTQLSVLSYDGDIKRVKLIPNLSSGRSLNFNRILSGIEFWQDENAVGSGGGSNRFRLYLNGSVHNCNFKLNSVISEYIEARMNGNFNNCYISAQNNQSVEIGQGGSIVTGVSSGNFTNCILKDLNIKSTSTTINIPLSFSNCILQNVRDLSNGSIIFQNKFSAILDRCSIQLNSNQSLFQATSVSEFSPSLIKNSIVESSIANTQIFGGNFDMEEYIMIENCVLYNTVPINPIYSLATLNVIQADESNFKSLIEGSPDYFQLTNASPARLYATLQNTDAGALQAAPLVLFPEINEVTENVAFGLGKFGDRIGTNRLAPTDKVELNFEYGDPLNPSVGTLPVASIFDGNILLEGHTVNGIAGKYRPADKFLYKEGETFGEENGTERIGEAEMKQAQHGRIPVVIKTSDGSPISATYPVPSQQFNVLKNYDIDLQLANTDIPERVGNGNITVIDNEDDELIYTMVLER